MAALGATPAFAQDPGVAAERFQPAPGPGNLVTVETARVPADFAYSFGLGVSFLAVGLAMGKLTRTLEWFKRHSRAITLVSAAILAVFGIILLTDSLPTLTAHMSNALRDNGLGWLVDAG